MFKNITILGAFFIGLITNAYTCPPVQIGNLEIIDHRWVRPSSGPNTAAYLTLVNKTQQPDKLVRVDCADATRVELHNHIEEDGVMKMRPVDFIEIGDTPVILKPGSLHIMLMGLKESFHGKKHISLTLCFEKAGCHVLEFPIQKPAG